MSDNNPELQIATQLLAARIIANQGRPASMAVMKLCVYEAYLLKKQKSSIASGISVDDNLERGHAEATAMVNAEIMDRAIDNPSDTHPSPRQRM